MTIRQLVKILADLPEEVQDSVACVYAGGLAAIIQMGVSGQMEGEICHEPIRFPATFLTEFDGTIPPKLSVSGKILFKHI